MGYSCPECKRELKPVVYSEWSMLNREQFDAQKAGDLYCDHCKGTRGKHNNYRYYWKSELENLTLQPSY